LAAIHNVRFYLNMVAQARQAIEAGDFRAFKADFLGRYLSTASAPVKSKGKKKQKRQRS